VLILGAAGTIGIREFVDAASGDKDAVQWVFVVGYALFAVSGVGAFVSFVSALSVQEVPKLPMDDRMVNHFDSHRYIDVIYSLSRRLIEATQEVRTQADKKIDKAAFGYRVLKWSLFFALVSAVAHLILQLNAGVA